MSTRAPMAPGVTIPTYEEGGHDYPIGFVRWTEGRNLEAIVDLLASGSLDVKSLITHRYPIEIAPDAYELITGKTEEPFLGVLLTYPESAQPEVRSAKIEVETHPALRTPQRYPRRFGSGQLCYRSDASSPQKDR